MKLLLLLPLIDHSKVMGGILRIYLFQNTKMVNNLIIKFHRFSYDFLLTSFYTNEKVLRYTRFDQLLRHYVGKNVKFKSQAATLVHGEATMVSLTLGEHSATTTYYQRTIILFAILILIFRIVHFVRELP